jgi:hypothetical protein
MKRTRATSALVLINNPFFYFVPVFIGIFVLMPIMMQYTIQRDTAANLLQEAYNKGDLQNPIEALIFLEKARVSQDSSLSFTLIMIVSMGLPLAFSGVLYLILPRIFPSYNFYWGDYMALYDKRQGRVKVFWTVIVLGILVSIAASLILRFF